MLWGLYTLGFDWEANDFFYFIADVAEAGGGRAPDHVRHRRRGRAPGDDARPPVGLRGRAAGPGRQRRLQPGPARRLGRGARLRLPAHEVARPPAGAHLADREASRSRRALENWREPDRGIWEVRGEPKHFTSSKLMCWVAADRGARLAEMRDELDYAARWQSAADEIQADILENAVDERGVFTQHYDTDALDASVLLMPLVRFLPPDDQRIVQDRARDRRRAHRGRARPPLPHGRDRRRPRGRGGHLRDLLVLARVGAGRDRRDPRARATCARSCSPTRARSASTRRRSTRARAATSATSRRRSPTWR